MATKERELQSNGNAHFRKWRWTMYSSLFVGWSLYYFCRKLLPSSMPNLIQEGGFTMDNIGSMTSSFSAAYGCSKFVCSVLSDRVSSKLMFSVGLVLSGACCITFVFFDNVTLCSVVWFLAGIVQGCGWAPCVILLKAWYPPTRIGTWWSILSSAGNIAGAISPILVAYITTIFSWQLSYRLVGTTAIVVGLLVLLTIKNSPSEVAMDISFEPTGSTLKEKDTSSEKDGKSDNRFSWYSAFFIGNVWICGSIYAFLYLFKNSVGDWTQLYFIQVAGKTQAVAAGCIGTMQLGGMAGNMAMGYISDLIITPNTEKTRVARSPALAVLAIILVFVVHLLATTVDRYSSELWLSILVFTIGFLVDGGIAVIGLVSMEVVPSNLAGSAHGLACAIAQVGAFMAGWPFASVVRHYSWGTAYQLLECCGFLTVGLCGYLLVLLVRRLPHAKNN